MSDRFREAQSRRRTEDYHQFYRNQAQAHNLPVSQRPSARDFLPRPLSRVQYYLPHSFALGAIVVVGGFALMSYNKNNNDAFESLYYSSW